MVCDPSSNSLNPPNLGPPPNLGFGNIFSPAQIPFPDLSLPPGIPEDIIEILETIFARIPGGKLIPSPDGAFDSVYDAISSLLNALSPYLAFYNFIQAILNMIICIIEVLCALMSPFKVIKAVRKLFKTCIPDFLAMFPFLALLAMILALILLLIALIEYLINTIIAMINDIIENIKNLAEAFQIGNAEGIIAITIKLSQLLCLIEQLFGLLIVFQVLFVIIKALAEIGGVKPCKRGDTCCDDETCPPFIGDNADGTVGTGGRLIYHRQYGLDVSSLGIPGFENLITPLRSERWQFVDDNNPEYPFNLIITPSGGSSPAFPFGVVSDSIYWPQPQTYNKDDSLTSTVPYTLDMRVVVDPAMFGHESVNGDFSGERAFQINDIIVSRQPYNGVFDHENDLQLSSSFGNSDGTLRLIGGKVFEDDGTTSFNIDGVQASLDTFIHRDSVTSSQLPSFEDGYQFSDITWNMKINHAVLMKYQIITAGCIPEIQAESEIMDATIPTTASPIVQIGALPDLDTALECLGSAISTFRQDMSIENAAIFQDSVVGCLEDLRDQSIEVFTKALISGVSIYKSDVEVNPEIQFVNRPIKLSVRLKDAGGNELGNTIPEASQGEVASLLDAQVTFGNVSGFTYDGYSLFVADITSDTAGTGTAQVSFNGNFFSEVLNRENDDVPSEISIITLPYEFVGFDGGQANPDPIVRRDETDTASGA